MPPQESTIRRMDKARTAIWDKAEEQGLGKVLVRLEIEPEKDRYYMTVCEFAYFYFSDNGTIRAWNIHSPKTVEDLNVLRCTLEVLRSERFM